MAATLTSIILVLIAQVIGAPMPILLKKWSVSFSFTLKHFLSPYLLGGLVCMAVSTVLFIAGLRGGDLSVLYPLVSTIYIWVCLLSVKFLGERMSSKKWVGIACVILGVALIGIGSR
ncbi:MAG: EamA family transporter [Nanoarchaeota archaeon]